MPGHIIHKAHTRGHADHGWLNSYHTFSFAGYNNKERMNFGVLRVLNDDNVSGGMGFGEHSHENMEIISIPLEGDLLHKDSMGNIEIIKEGDIQAMSAGSGISHSEQNNNKDRPVKFLQIWLFPDKKNVTPRYSQFTMNFADRKNKLQQILSPDPTTKGVWIHQKAWFHIGNLDKGTSLSYHLKNNGNGIYAFILKGNVTIQGETLSGRDGMGIWDIKDLSITAESDCEILLMDIPMEINN